MISKEQGSNKATEASKKRLNHEFAPESVQFERGLSPGSIVQRARIDPSSLSPRDVLQLQRIIGNRAVGRLAIIQRHPLDDDVLSDPPLLDKVVQRIEDIAYGNDKREPIQERVTDLWKKQGELMNQLRAELTGLDEDSPEAQALNDRIGKFSPRLAFAKSFLPKEITLPPIPIYISQHGTKFKDGGGN